MRRYLVLVLGLSVLMAAGCGGPAVPPTPVPQGVSALDRCPPPLLTSAGSTRARRVRLVNRTADTVTVFIDRCFHHTRVASVSPGGSRLMRLPEPLVAFPEGLRFHAYHASRGEHIGVFTVAVTDAPVIDLLLAADAAVPDSRLTPVAFNPGDGRVGSFAVSDGPPGAGGPDRGPDQGGYAAVWARRTLAILTWACDAGGRRHLTLSTGDKLGGGPATVRLRWDGGTFADAGSWTISTNVTDAVLAPRAQVDALTRRALAANELDVLLIDDQGGRHLHEFTIEGLERALEARRCFAELLDP